MLKKLFLFFGFISAVMTGYSVCNPYTVPANESGYIPFVFINNSGTVTNANLYVTIIGTNPSTNKSCIVELTSSGGQLYGTLVDVSLSTRSLDYSYAVSSFPTQGSQPVIYLPPITNANIFLSVDYKMALSVVTTGPTIQGPALFATTDANYYHLYDNSISFTSDAGLNLQSNYTTGFGLPLSVLVSMNAGTSTRYAGISANRASIFTTYSTLQSAIANANAKNQWGKILKSFTSESGGGITNLRLASMYSAMNFSSSPFDTSYLLDAASYGINWAQETFDPAPHSLYFDFTDLATPGKAYSQYEYMGITAGNMVFSPVSGSYGTNVLIPYPVVSSLPFLNASSAAAPTGFNASGDTTIIPNLCSYLSAGFVSGVFPASAPDTDPFGTTYLSTANVNGDFYQPNSSLSSNESPWYDLYGKVLHTVADATSFKNFQADTMDSFLGYYSPIIVSHNASALPSVFIVLGSLSGTVVPNFTDTNLYSVTIAPASGTTVVFNGTAVPIPHTFSNVSMPFTLEITYSTGDYSGQTYTSEVWLNTANNYSVVFPQPASALNPTYNSETSTWVVGVGPSP